MFSTKVSSKFIFTVLTSTQLVVRTVTVKVVTFAVLAAVDLCSILTFLALTGAANTVAVVAADIRSIVFPAVGVQVLCANIVFAAFTTTPDTTFVAPDMAK